MNKYEWRFAATAWMAVALAEALLILCFGIGQAISGA